MTTKAVYPGSFDPLTNGHLDIINRARQIFSHLVVAVADNSRKQHLFDLDERLEMVGRVIGHDEKVSVQSFDGLLVSFAQQIDARAIVRGVRAVSDFEYEFQMALMNRRLSESIETVFLMPSEEYTFLSSKLVKEVAGLGGDVSGLVPESVLQRLSDRFRSADAG